MPIKLLDGSYARRQKIENNSWKKMNIEKLYYEDRYNRHQRYTGAIQSIRKKLDVSRSDIQWWGAEVWGPRPARQW